MAGTAAAASKKSAAAARPKKSGSGGGSVAKKAYLIAYNAASAVAWAAVLGRVAVVLAWRGAPFVPLVVDNFARITQTFAVMEILHAITGVVPAQIFTTLLQVASRLILVWGIALPFPELSTSPWYSSMLLAWSTTEVVRYSYFVFKQVDAVPSWLNWMRYSGFLVLYPVGISSEVAMMLKAVAGPAASLSEWYPLALIAVLLAYIPSSFVLYTHMLKQRRKNVGGGASAALKKRQ